MSQKQQLLPSINENKKAAVGTSIIHEDKKQINDDDNNSKKKNVELTNVQINEKIVENNNDKKDETLTPQKSIKLLKSETEMNYETWNSAGNDLMTVMNTSGGQQTWKDYREKVENILEIDNKLIQH